MGCTVRVGSGRLTQHMAVFEEQRQKKLGEKKNAQEKTGAAILADERTSD
jgi:hypothetical protein